MLTMWLEIIAVRPAEDRKPALREFLEQWQGQLTESPGSTAIEVFIRPPLGADTAIHIRHHTGVESPVTDPLGLRLMEDLRQFGPVKRSLWTPFHI
jgi:hypothetical protein